jgi:hypothetical protein
MRGMIHITLTMPIVLSAIKRLKGLRVSGGMLVLQPREAFTCTDCRP